MPLILKNLIGKLNETTRSALEAGAALCVSRTHYNIEIDHYLNKLLQAKNTDLTRICSRFKVDTARLEAELQQGLDKYRSGNRQSPALSATLVTLFRDAWCIASINYGATRIRSGHTVLALLGGDVRPVLPSRTAEAECRDSGREVR